MSDFTATVQADLDRLSSCNALRGTLNVAGDLDTAAIANVRAIYGSLIVNNATSLTSFSADSLTTITGQLSMTDLTVLSSLNLGDLASVGSINFITLPALEQITFGTGISDIESLYISDTSLSSLEGFNIINVETFNVNNNRYLNSIDSQLESVSQALEVSYNSEDVEVSFDSLKWANNITFRDVSSVSLANLSTVNSSLGIYNCKMDSFNATGVEQIGGYLSINNNDGLEEVGFPSLSSVGGGLVIANNSELTDVAFDRLRTVGGAVNLVGNFTDVEMGSLRTVRGGFVIDSRGDLNCDAFNRLDRQGVIQGDRYVCRAASSSTSTRMSSTSGGSSSTGGSSSSSSSSDSGSESSSTSTGTNGAPSNGNAIVATSIFGSVAAIILAML